MKIKIEFLEAIMSVGNFVATTSEETLLYIIIFYALMIRIHNCP